MTPPKYIKWFVAEESVVIENDIPITCYKLVFASCWGTFWMLSVIEITH